MFNQPQEVSEEEEEEEDEEQVQEEDPPETSGVTRGSDGKERRTFYENLYHILPGKIHMSSDGRHRSLINIPGIPHIVLSPDWEDSWFATPEGSGNDSVGIWPPNTKFPGHNSADHMVPESSQKKVPIKFDYHVQDPELKAFLNTSKLIDSKGNLRLDPAVFTDNSFSLPKHHLGPSVDKMLRVQFADVLVTDELVDVTDSLVTSAARIPIDNPLLDQAAINILLLEKLKLIRNSVLLSSASNLRARHNILSAIVRNKLSLREEVLQAHWGGAGSNNIKEALLHSSFFSTQLFGPLPESIIQNCVKNPALVLKPRKGSSTGGSSSLHTSSSVMSHQNPASEAGAASSDYKRAKSHSNQDFRSSTNPSRARLKEHSSSTKHKKGQQ